MGYRKFNQKNLDGIYNSVVNSKKKIKEAKVNLGGSLKTIAEDNQRLVKINYKMRILKAIEDINEEVLTITQHIEKGVFYQAMKVHQKASFKLEQLDNNIRSTGVLMRIKDLLDEKKKEIKQLCEYYLLDQIFSTEEQSDLQDILNKIDFENIVFDVVEDAFAAFGEFGKDEAVEVRNKKEGQDQVEKPAQKILGKKRINFLYSIVHKMDNFTVDGFMKYIDISKLDSVLNVMFDREIVTVFEELDKKSKNMFQIDNKVNYFNIFLSVKCLKELYPDIQVHDILVWSLDENFNRVFLNCFNSYRQDINILEMNASMIKCYPLQFFVWESELVKGLLPESFLLTNIPNLENLLKLIIVVIFFGFQYLADFIKICLFLYKDDTSSIDENIGYIMIIQERSVFALQRNCLS